MDFIYSRFFFDWKMGFSCCVRIWYMDERCYHWNSGYSRCFFVDGSYSCFMDSNAVVYGDSLFFASNSIALFLPCFFALDGFSLWVTTKKNNALDSIRTY